jgi:hypothetical protein
MKGLRQNNGLQLTINPWLTTIHLREHVGSIVRDDSIG